MADFKEAIREKNRVAHTQVLRSEYETILEALSSVSQKNSLAQKENESLLLLREELKRENEDLRLKNNDLYKQIHEKIQTLESKEQEVTTRCNEKEASCKSIEQDSRDKVLKIRSEIDGLTSVLGGLIKSIEDVKNMLSFQEHEIARGGLTLNQIRVKIEDASSEFRSLKTAKNKELRDIHKQIVASNQELIDVRLLIEDEKKKISMPMELLRKANEEINRKKSDLDIYKTQLDNHWEEILKRRKL